MNLNFKKIANRILCVSIFAFTVSSCQNDMDFVDPTEKNDVIQKLEAHGFTISHKPLTRSDVDIYQVTEANVDEFLREYEFVKNSIENNPIDTTVIFDLMPVGNRIKTRSESPTESLLIGVATLPQGTITHNLQVSILQNNGTYKFESAYYSITGLKVGTWSTEIRSTKQMSNNTFRIVTHSVNTVSVGGVISVADEYDLEWTITADINSNDKLKATVKGL